MQHPAANPRAQLKSKSASMPTPELREAKFEDYPQVTSLAKEYGMPLQRTFDEWRHLWVSNPAYRKFGVWPIGWVLEAEGRIVGHLGNIPSLYELGDRQLLCASGYAWVVAT